MSGLDDDLALLAAAGESLETAAPKTYTAREARLIAGFEDIQRFVAEHGRVPEHGTDRDIFERLYAVRLDRLREMEEAKTLLAAFDSGGLLSDTSRDGPELDDAALLAAAGAESGPDITELRHVSPTAHRRAAEEIAGRDVCREFAQYELIFERAKADLKSGMVEARQKIRIADFEPGAIFIVGGQMALIAHKGEEFDSSSDGDKDARMLVVYDNGTESRDLLMRSLQRALHKDKAGRVLSRPDAGPLFGDATDNRTGTVYVLRSSSTLPEVQAIREAAIKIGVTGGSVERRIANAENEPTFLLGPVDIVDRYELFNIVPHALERTLHRVFASARLDISIEDRFGNPVRVTEWFAVPPGAVAEAVEQLKQGVLGSKRWDASSADWIEGG